MLVKRLIDVILSLTALTILSPSMLIIALSILATSGLPVLYRQKRVGLDGKEFTLLKFRSMVPGAESMGTGIRVTENDNRITPIGAFLRRWSLDELPQLINVLRGDMSIVGPRPVLPNHPKKVAEYTPEERLRFTVRPGLTGLAQINGRGNLSWEKKLQYDVEYVRNWSLLLDLKIMWRTLLIILDPKDIYLKEQGGGKEGDHVSSR